MKILVTGHKGFIGSHVYEYFKNEFGDEFEVDGIDFPDDIGDFKTDTIYDCIIQLAREKKTGARALKSILEDCMLDIMFEAPSIKGLVSCTITEEVINNSSKPIYKKFKKTA